MDRPEDGQREGIAELREHAQMFAANAPGPLRLLRMRAGDVSIEVQWHGAEPGHAPGPPSPLTRDAADEAPGLVVIAPMVGTFYRAPAPGAPAFVEPGDLVEPGQTVGIVEAMKLMNPVAAECHGRVTAVLVADAEPVEFGQPLVALAATATADAAPPATAGEGGR